MLLEEKEPSVAGKAGSAAVFVVTSAIPYRRHGLEGISAVHVVVHEIIRSLKDRGYDLCLQVLLDETYQLTPSDHDELQHLRRAGVNVLPPLSAPAQTAGFSMHAQYPAARLKPIIDRRTAETRSGVVLTIWSPEGVAATHSTPVPRIIYHGDIDFGPWQARALNPSLFPVQSWMPRTLANLLDRFQLASFRRAHMRLIRRTDVIANVTAANARFYSDRGHPRSIYMPNTWTEDGSSSKAAPVCSQPPYKIIGHAGYLNRTGSTFGLSFLMRELVPALDTVMADLDYRIHIIGSGEIAPSLRPYLSHPRLVVRGFVPDLTEELSSSHAFLLLNNAGSYHAAYTRHILAWSMGLCLIAHSNSKLAIPEMEHMKNCLMANSALEIAELVRRSVLDPALNHTVRQGGRETYDRYFRPEHIASALAREIDGVLSGASVTT